MFNPFIYNFSDKISGDTIQHSSCAIIGVVSWNSFNTFDFKKFESLKLNKFGELIGELEKIKNDQLGDGLNNFTQGVFQIQQYALEVKTTFNKTSPTPTFSGSFADPDNKLIKNIRSGGLDFYQYVR